MASSKSEQLKTLYQSYAHEFPEVKSIRASELHAELEEDKDSSKIILIDVRTAEEQKVSRLPGNVLTKEEFEICKQRYLNSPLVTYCTAGVRSGRYAKVLQEEGFKNVRNFEGSILAWTQAGYPLVTPDQEATKQVHVCAEQWALQGDDYKPVWFSGLKGALLAVGGWGSNIWKKAFGKK
ncbi:Rhodanese-like protein [Coccomyxa subellipsoidea C-169]|uniref:Rhodanese-like protein n=1 Tax=Coccomyxa subellipsoidea (strain C-169) TaxID=574566 RepID=I0YUF8_COCSC|nr:Rhodanese-like protein [Coccomyxa subellipsoidea C-169]EIE22027.1 Rhodanese-like protein [Coccomyxa subellipsoidea C-169]|eukprot:XP_005646571.1 Rhodanese-like protein [Coccomyxa subellipsoidea C-169]